MPFAGLAEYNGTHRWTQMTLVLLGDPELRIFTATPRTLSVSAPSSVGLGDGEPGGARRGRRRGARRARA